MISHLSITAFLLVNPTRTITYDVPMAVGIAFTIFLLIYFLFRNGITLSKNSAFTYALISLFFLSTQNLTRCVYVLGYLLDLGKDLPEDLVKHRSAIIFAIFAGIIVNIIAIEGSLKSLYKESKRIGESKKDKNDEAGNDEAGNDEAEEIETEDSSSEEEPQKFL